MERAEICAQIFRALMMMQRLLTLILLAALTPSAWAIDKLQVDSLSRVADLAKQRNVPILLIVSQHHCPYCDLLKEEIIAPMYSSGDYEQRVVMAEIMLDSDTEIPDFQGNLVSPAQIADSYRVWVTPTLLFVDHTGVEVHRRMLGVNTIDYYGYYLDESLAAALKAVRNNDRSYSPVDRDIHGDAPNRDQLL